jgi:hypothetical protein
MRLLKTAFHRSLLKEAAGIRLRERPGDQVHRSIRFVFDFSRFPSYPPSELGRLFALLVAQAEADGATRMRFCCGTSQMFYTVEGVDYDMVPPSPMAMADMMRLVFQSCRRSAMDAGTLRVRFADETLMLEIRVLAPSQEAQGHDPIIDITGFTGEALASASE